MNLLNYYDRTQALNPVANGNLALQFVRNQGLPTRKDEDWKYTSLKFFSDNEYVPASLLKTKLDHEELLLIQKNFSSSFTNIVFINGILDTALSEVLPAEVLLREAINDKSVFVDSVEAINTLYSPVIYTISVKKEAVVAKPINLILWSQGAMALVSSCLRISIETRANVQFLLTYQGDDTDHVTNSVVEVQVADNAKASIIKTQEDNLAARHIGLTRIQVAKNAEVESVTFSTGAKLSRHTLEVLMQGEGSTAKVHGAYAVTGDQHVDNNTTIDHLVGNCNTFQLYKGLLDGQSRAVFNGKVLIRRHAQKANSEQLNNNLLLSRMAEVDSKPMLQIDADDVKAAHGSTVGQMDEEELFYLLSRAISKPKAITMLSYGFLSEVVYRVENKTTQEWLTQKLDAAFGRISTEHL